MDSREKLIEAFNECGEAAAFYKGQRFLMVNDLFAELIERNKEDCKNLAINDVVHNDSIEMIQDFIRRRAHHDLDVPITYNAFFKIPSNPRIEMKVLALRLRNSEGESLVLVRGK